MRRTIFIVLCVFQASCSASTSTTGTQGHADFSYTIGTVSKPADKPIASGSDVTLRIVLHDNADPTFRSAASDVLQVVSSSRAPLERTWFVLLHAQNEGKSRVSVNAGTTLIDTIDLEVAKIAKLELPSSAEVKVSNVAALDVTAKGAAGQELFAPSAIAWSVDHPEVVQFWDSLRNTTQPSASGTNLQIRGVALGAAKVTGTYEKTAVNVPVTVK